eukprot:TRINITY_DN28326_c0_g1_i1.p2 TRINITY_DN28326_c0_g1~~TRINITY_DN28326_c0_g1_i1.p2  ORF type:complete len:272 (+),score=43.31 TRINITY_DN28326_c0_g1_i1:74-817(+)
MPANPSQGGVVLPAIASPPQDCRPALPQFPAWATAPEGSADGPGSVPGAARSASAGGKSDSGPGIAAVGGRVLASDAALLNGCLFGPGSVGAPPGRQGSIAGSRLRNGGGGPSGPASGISAMQPKGEMRQWLAQEKRLRVRAESEAAILRASTDQAREEGVQRGRASDSEVQAPRLTSDILARHTELLARARLAKPGSMEANLGKNAMEVLQWKHLVKQAERRQIARENAAQDRRVMEGCVVMNAPR